MDIKKFYDTKSDPRQQMVDAINKCIAKAESIYGKLPNIESRYDLKGKSAGQAGFCGRNFYIRLNLNVEPEYLKSEVIPHEIAHIVAFYYPRLGARGHNRQWKEIAKSLGCSGETYHRLILPSARKRTISRHIYLVDGNRIMVGPKYHNRIQRYGINAGIRVKRTGTIISNMDYVETIRKEV